MPGFYYVMDGGKITYELSEIDAGQVIDGLSVCQENWQKTLDWYDGTLKDPDFTILECRDRDEAANMVRIYDDLLETLCAQLRAQLGKSKAP